MILKREHGRVESQRMRCSAAQTIVLPLFFMAVLPQVLRGASVAVTGRAVNTMEQPVSRCYVKALVGDRKGMAAEVSVVGAADGMFTLSGPGDTVRILAIRSHGYRLQRYKPEELVFTQERIARAAGPFVFRMIPSDEKEIAQNSYRFSFRAGDNREYAIDLTKSSGEKPATKREARVLPKAESALPSVKLKPADDETDPNSRQKRFSDVRFDCRQTQDGRLQLVMSTLGKHSGIVTSEQMLYVCPLEGYEPHVTLDIPRSTTTRYRKYAYVKARGGDVYARLVLEVKAGDNVVFLSVMTDANTNASPVIELITEEAVNMRKVDEQTVEDKFRRRDEEIRKRRQTN